MYTEVLGGPIIDEIVAETLHLCRIPGPTGWTEEISAYVEQKLRSYGYEPSRIHKGGLLCDLGGTGDTLVVSAHLDAIGTMVSHILPNGHLRLAVLGGVVFANLDAENCTVYTRGGAAIPGTLQLNEPSTHANGEVRTRERSRMTMEVVLDRETSSAAETRDLGIENGDYVVFDPKAREEGGFIKSRALDDRVQVAILLVYAKWLRDTGKTPARHTVLQFADFEEVGFGGSTGLPEDTREFLAADVGIVGKELEGNEFAVSIVAKDSAMPYDPRVTRGLINAAVRAGAPYAVEVYPERYGSDAGAAVRAGYDVRVGLFGPGVSATHGYERTHKKAIAATFAMLASYIGY
ncbi:MAG: M42 family metallopeptidase [Clostridiaceae bacterium]|nr:M42 family metallopeptidase [Clostridiaceae bacterium]